MNDETRDYINSLAGQLRKTYGVEVPITDLNGLVKSLGGTVKEKNGEGQPYEGTIRKTGDSSFEIVLSPYQSSERKNFTIAHELGHLFLHMGYIISPDTWNSQDENYQYKRYGNSEREYQANEFAAALLMPMREFKEQLDHNTHGNKVDMRPVADYFKVSLSAAVNRGRFLGYLR